jgi:hypothetical protein
MTLEVTISLQEEILIAGTMIYGENTAPSVFEKTIIG